MVLEAVVVDLLNRVLADYVINLDRSQLSLSIWGGDVVLENLQIREDALSEFDLPFRVTSGVIGRLTLKIPWKNLYSAAVVATLEDLTVLVVPSTSVAYDAAKELRLQREAKQKELQRIEEMVQKARNKGSKKVESDTFVEKLATQILRNLQLKVSRIHVRYEDNVTYPSRAVAVGITLGSLSFQTTNSNWVPCLIHETEEVVFNKLGQLDSLAVYCNINGTLISQSSQQQALELLKHGVATSTHVPPLYQYILPPVCGVCRVSVCPPRVSSTASVTRPKVDVESAITSLALTLSHEQ
ncbi:intermembrane lipid transfer protein VPS13C-like, partial [Lampetra fluviatilis]